MSVYVHDCAHCGHRQDHHHQGIYAKCPHPGGQPEPLYQPGSRRNPGSGHKSDVCACDRCQELYAEAVGS